MAIWRRVACIKATRAKVHARSRASTPTRTHQRMHARTHTRIVNARHCYAVRTLPLACMKLASWLASKFIVVPGMGRTFWGHGSSLSDPPKFTFHWSSSHRHHVVGHNWLHRKIHHNKCILLSDAMDGNSLSCSVRCSGMWKLVQWRWRLWFPSKLSFSYTKLHGVTCYNQWYWH